MGEIVKHRFGWKGGEGEGQAHTAPSLPGTGGTSCLRPLGWVLLNLSEIL